MKARVVYQGMKNLVFGILSLMIAVACSSSSGNRSAVLSQIALTPAASGFTAPTYVTHAGDGSGRVFIVERGGMIKIMKNRIVSAEPFLDISSRVSTAGEGGLLSMAFPPDYATRKYFYVYYTSAVDNIAISRFHVSAADPDVADPGNEERILNISHPDFTNHYGGQVAFGPDGYLYIAPGDGGGAGDSRGNAQNPATLLGKMLRIDTESGVVPYAVPPDNPFVGNAAYQPEIWALGLRNAWRFSFDSLNGDLYIGDVGQNTYEEIDLQTASSPGGENYGWNIMEGAHCFNSDSCDQTGLTLPVAEYDHTEGCSVTGGYVYRGPSFPRSTDTTSTAISAAEGSGACKAPALSRSNFSIRTSLSLRSAETRQATSTSRILRAAVSTGSS